MKSRNKRHEQRVKKLIVMCLFCVLFCGISTYAWFIGMKTVNVTTFDVKIAAIDSLSLSLNGKDFSDTVTINEENYNDTTVVYAGNTNSWGGDGLIPMSSVGVIDPDASRLILFEKGSLTTTPGGYRLLASRVRNYAEGSDPLPTEQNGYVVFDLFIRNLSGTEYYQDLNELNEEPIYLIVDSTVEVADMGNKQAGIENSVRVAFAQIGRVTANANKDSVNGQAAVTGITCTTNGSADYPETSICSRVAQIWEPNDQEHVQNAINWYDTSCAPRNAQNLTLDASYGEYGGCGTVQNGTSYPTYAVSGEINVADYVDVYDGTGYNGYTGSVATEPTEGKLMAYDTFTDTEKNYDGTDRPTFITLAPNSITKVRVYVYIEGQDVDNYDFASLGRKIRVSFGFTKERFFDEDVNYDDEGTATLPSDVVKDNHPDLPTRGA